MTIKPINDFIIVEKIEESKSGLILSETKNRGKVLASHKDSKVKKGDIIVYLGVIPFEDYLIVKEEDIIGIEKWNNT